MPLVKVAHGLLEEDNYYLTSPAQDFLGSGVWSRTEGEFRLRSGEVMRRLPYDSFMIDVRKNIDGPAGNCEFFLESGGARLGLREKAGDTPATDWRIVYYDGFVQGFASYDGGTTWSNMGGERVSLEGEILQGFKVTGGAELVLTGYRLYSSPYLTVQNFAPGLLARLEDEDGAVLERFFDENYECRLYLERARKCAVVVTDGEETLFSSGFIDFTPGDVFLFSTEYLQLLRGGLPLGPGATDCKTLETLTVRNTGPEDTQAVTVAVENVQDDSVLLSRDGQTWGDSIGFEHIEAGGEYEFYLKITRADGGGQFKVKQFELCVY